MVRHSYGVSENRLNGTKDIRLTYTDSLILCIIHYVGLYVDKLGVKMSFHAFKANCNISFSLPVDSGYGYTRVGTLIVAAIYLQLIQNRYMFPSFTVLQCSHQHCVQPVASDVEVVGYL